MREIIHKVWSYADFFIIPDDSGQIFQSYLVSNQTYMQQVMTKIAESILKKYLKCIKNKNRDL